MMRSGAGNPVVACGEGCLELTEFQVESHGLEDSRRMLLRSMRNRLRA